MGFQAGMAVVTVMLLAACSAGRGPTDPASLAVAGGDAAVFAAHCSVCHALPHPERHDAAGWRILVPVMELRMSQRGLPALSEEEKASILSYLERHAR